MKKALALLLLLTTLFSVLIMTACDLGGENSDGESENEDGEAEVETFTLGLITYDLPKAFMLLSGASDPNAETAMNMHTQITTGSTVTASVTNSEGSSIDGLIPQTPEEAKAVAASLAGATDDFSNFNVSLNGANSCRVTFVREAMDRTMYFTVVLCAKTNGEMTSFLTIVLAEMDEARPAAAVLSIR